MVLTNICLSFFTTDSAKSLFSIRYFLATPKKIFPHPMQNSWGRLNKMLFLLFV